jgi:dTDP-4-dehydrorhamnose reductase
LTLVQEGAPFGIYHVVNSGSATWFEFAREIVERASVKANVVPTTSAEYPTVAIRPPYSALDNRKTAAIVGDIPGWRDALDRYLAEKGHVQLARTAAVTPDR